MLRPSLLVGFVLALTINTQADYVAARRAAVALTQAGKQAEALAAFTNLAARAESALQKSDALEQATLRAGALRQHDLAMELARQIPLPAVSKYCRMRILNETSKDKELVAEFKDEPIGQWPESAVGAGSLYRGMSYYRLKDGKAADADLTRATAYLPDEQTRAIAWLALGDNCRANLNDDSQALAAYAKTQETLRDATTYIGLTALVSKCSILNKQGKHDEALQSLQQVDVSKMSGHWKAVLLHAHGETLAGQGKKSAAVAKFNKAIAVPDIPASVKALYEKDLKVFQAGAHQ
jgi:hypothetical protein